MNIWIIDAISGLTVFYHNILGMEVDEDLISGLLAALNLLSEREFDQSGIESIDMSGLRWCYAHSKEYNLLFVAAEDKRTNADTLRSRLMIIQSDFIAKYALILAEWQANKQHQSIKYFGSYKSDIDNLVAQWREAEKVASTGILFDLLGVFQQILNLIVEVIEKYLEGDEKERTYRNIENFFGIFMSALKNGVKESDKELMKITFSKESGWDLLGIDATKADIQTFPKVFLDIVNMMKKFIVFELGYARALEALSINLFPYLMNNWNLLEELNMAKLLFNIFLNVRTQ